MARLSEGDARTWAALGARIGPWIERRLAAGVVGNRGRTDGSTWRPMPLRSALADARRAAATLARTSGVVVRTDVAAFYPSVTPSVLYASLRPGPGADDARLAANLLDRWGSNGYAGLPIGPDASAVLANAVLMPVDAALGTVPFLRWVDDYVIGVCCESRGADVLERIDASLERVGLRRALAKTVVAEGGRDFAWLGTSGALDPSN